MCGIVLSIHCVWNDKQLTSVTQLLNPLGYNERWAVRNKEKMNDEMNKTFGSLFWFYLLNTVFLMVGGKLTNQLFNK